jgi:hypothetical protein
MSDMEVESVGCNKSDALLAELVSSCEGLREAYALLITALWRLNFDMNDKPVSIDQLCDEVCISLRSIVKRIAQ